MTTQLVSQTTDSEAYTAPAWLAEALQPNGSAPFRDRCRAAAQVGRSLMLMRQANEQRGFILQTVPDLVRSLGATARAPLAAIAAWAELPLDGPAGPTLAAGWSRLARALGMGLREALLHLRLTFAVEAGATLPVSASRDAGPADLFADCEAFLTSTIGTWEEPLRNRLRESERLLREDYQTAELFDHPMG